MEEKKLIQKAQKGEREAFGEIYDAYLPKIYRFVYLKVSNKGDAEDITSQVFMRAWKNIRSFKFQGFPFSSWLYRIANNAVIDFYRTRKDSVDIESIAETAYAESRGTDTEMDTEIEIDKVRSVLKLLKPDEQSVLIMKFVDELSNKEIAKTLEKTDGAVRVIQHRALKQMRELFAKNEAKHNTTT